MTMKSGKANPYALDEEASTMLSINQSPRQHQALRNPRLSSFIFHVFWIFYLGLPSILHLYTVFTSTRNEICCKTTVCQALTVHIPVSTASSLVTQGLPKVVCHKSLRARQEIGLAGGVYAGIIVLGLIAHMISKARDYTAISCHQ